MAHIHNIFTMKKLVLLLTLVGIPLHGGANLSGVLQRQLKTTTVGENGTSRTVEKPFFAVDRCGSISVESMKGTAYYDHAKACDTRSPDGWLKCEEIKAFLKLFSRDDQRTETNDLMYYRETNEKGVIIKICTLIVNANAKEDGEEQMVLEYNDYGNLITQILYQTSGKKYEGTSIYDLRGGMVTHINEQGDTISHRLMKRRNYKVAESSSKAVKNQKKSALKELFLSGRRFFYYFVPLLIAFIGKIIQTSKSKKDARFINND